MRVTEARGLRAPLLGEAVNAIGNVAKDVGKGATTTSQKMKFW